MSDDWTTLLVSLLSFVFMILVWIFVSQRFGGTRRLNEFSEFYKAQVSEMQRTNALLDRIAVALEKRAHGPP